MKKTKEIAVVAMCSAMLIGGQLALSSISGVEIVTVLMLCFAYSFGIKNAVAIATTFSLLRCLVFGFHVNVIILYLIYYNLFAIFFGWLGKRFSDKISLPRTIIVVLSAVLFTVFFTFLDNVLTSLMYGFNEAAMKTYFVASLSAVIPQTICTIVTVSLLFYPLTRVISKIKI